MALVSTPFAFDAGTLRGSVALTSATLFDTEASGHGYFILFEAVGLLLLSAMVAAVLMAKRRLGTTDETEGGEN